MRRIGDLFQRFAYSARLTSVLVVSSLCFVTSALAHEIRPAVIDAWIGGGEVRLEVDLALESLIAGVDASVFSDTNDSPQAGEYDRLRQLDPQALESALRAAWSQVQAGFTARTVGQSDLKFIVAGVEVAPIGDVDLPRDSSLILVAPLDPAAGPVEVGAKPSIGPIILRHRGAGDDAFAALLSVGEISPPLPQTGGAAESAGATFLRYIGLGVEHIVPKGLDHILFVLGLFFFSIKMRPLLMQVTAFTLAHTVTLALAALGWVSVPAAIVEPLIAASIVYVAVENLRGGELRRSRTAVVFAFGLLHGLGFASVLGDIGLAQGQFLVSLIGFNIGVELGQLLVIAGAFLLVGIWFGQREFYVPYIARPASVLIGATGAWWMVERIFL